MRRAAALALASAVLACGGSAHPLHDGPTGDATGVDAPADAGSGTAPLLVRFEAEDTTLVGSATVVGASDLSSRSAGDLAGEASVRRAVTLAGSGDGISFVVDAQAAGANAIVVRYSVPDLATGGGQNVPLALAATAADGTPIASTTLTLTSRYTWVYGSVAAGTKQYNTPAAAQTNDGASLPIHVYDETQLLLAAPLPVGATVALTLPAAGLPAVTLDFVELEGVPAPLAQPADLLSIADARCGAIALDSHGTGRAFDGIDDAAYASVFVAVAGINPFNPTGSNGVQPAGTNEKDYYTSGSADALQDGSASAASANLSMFALADRNQQALATCLTTAAGSGYAGIWIPPGRYYARGTVAVPSNTQIRGAGIWYSKLVAVDTAPPAPATNPGTGLSGIASVSGDLRFVAASGAGGGSAGTTNVAIGDLAMFGNVTQRDVVDRFIPIGIIGAFAASTFERIWVEHTSQGLVMNGSASADTLRELRVRDTFADGVDLFGDTSGTAISDSASRTTGDDGFAVWSQSATSVSSGNSVTDCTTELPWFGDGFAVYGGSGAVLDHDTAIDTLSIAGFKLGTVFVPPALPATFAMTATVTNATMVRCGGDGFANRSGALQIGPQDEAIALIAVTGASIIDPTFAGIDLRVLSSVGKLATPGTVNVTLSAVDVVAAGSAGCATVGAQMTGSGDLGACACSAAGSAASACGVTNASATTFAVGSVCSELVCPP